jgi:SPP1 family predicted phage head-tail adaptor
MEIGNLRQRITIRAKTRTPDDSGGHSEAWSDLATVWAKVENAAGALGTGSRSLFERMGLQTIYTHRMTIRYRTGIEDYQRVLYDGKEYEIHAIENIGERDEYLRLYCKEAKT